MSLDHHVAAGQDGPGLVQVKRKNLDRLEPLVLLAFFFFGPGGPSKYIYNKKYI